MAVINEGYNMVVTKPESWRWLTPIFGVLNFFGIMIVGIIGFFLVRTIDQFDKHLDRIDIKFDQQAMTNQKLDHQITLVQGQCCRKSLLQAAQEESTGG